jgi:hypothetical protein
MNAMSKQITAIALACALVLSLFAFSGGTAQAQRNTTAAPGQWGSAILIQNTGAGSAEVEVIFYDAQGAVQKTYKPANIAGGKSVTLLVGFDDTTFGDLTAGQYSAQINSTEPVIASVQTSSIESTGPWTAFAYEGVSSTDTATKLFFPANYKNFYGFFSEMVIQNAGTAATNLSVEFYAQNGTLIGAAIDLGSLGLNSAKTFATNDAIFNSLPTGDTNGIFGAVVTSSAGPIAGIANLWRTAPTNMTASYNAFTQGSTTLYAPILTNNYYGFGSQLTIQNIHPTENAVVTITYTNGQTENFTLQPNVARGVYTPANANLPSGNDNGVFSAKVTTVGGSIVGQVGYSRPPELNGNAALGDYASYNCPPVASAEVNVPNILSNYYGLFSNVSVQNTGTQTTDITLTYEDGKKWTITGIAPNGVANFLHLNPGGPIQNPLPTLSSVSGVASSSNGQPLVAVVQHNTEPQVTGFDLAKLPSDFLHVFTATPK